MSAAMNQRRQFLDAGYFVLRRRATSKLRRRRVS
jgi:hypothetical protein